MNHVSSISKRSLALALAGAVLLTPVAARADDGRCGDGGGGGGGGAGAAANPLKNVVMTGQAQDGRPFIGSLDIQRFQQIGNQIFAIGLLTGRVAGDRAVQRQAVAIPLTASQSPGGGASNAAPTPQRTGSLSANGLVVPASYVPSARPRFVVKVQQAACPILNLNLQALDLNLLGLVVHLDPVVLNVGAQPGPGNLLGNLLCAVTGLLDPLSILGLVNLLNGIANALNGLGALGL